MAQKQKSLETPLFPVLLLYYPFSNKLFIFLKVAFFYYRNKHILINIYF